MRARESEIKTKGLESAISEDRDLHPPVWDNIFQDRALVMMTDVCS
jgi:hypothetical protein